MLINRFPSFQFGFGSIKELAGELERRDTE